MDNYLGRFKKSFFYCTSYLHPLFNKDAKLAIFGVRLLLEKLQQPGDRVAHAALVCAGDKELHFAQTSSVIPVSGLLVTMFQVQHVSAYTQSKSLWDFLLDIFIFLSP